MTQEKSVYVVAREWNNPQIHVFVSNEVIGMKMPLSDYLDALVEQIGNPALIMTQNQLKTKLQVAAAEVEATVKKYSTAVIKQT
jgi:hypothetical protein